MIILGKKDYCHMSCFINIIVFLYYFSVAHYLLKSLTHHNQLTLNPSHTSDHHSMSFLATAIVIVD